MPWPWPWPWSWPRQSSPWPWPWPWPRALGLGLTHAANGITDAHAQAALTTGDLGRRQRAVKAACAVKACLLYTSDAADE